MRRFEAFGGSLPAQPDVERLSPRVICVLGMNPSPYTLNGTCCYLVGTGPVRILVDAGGWPGGQEAEVEFVAHLKATLAEERVTSLSTIIVTHLHTDHFGGCRALQGVLGAPVPVAMLAPPPSQLSLYTIREIRARGLFDAVRAGPAPLFTGPTTFGFGGVPLPAWPNEDLSWDRARRTKRQMQADFFYALQHADFVDAWRDPRNESLPGVELHDGDAICVAGATLRVVATPGHAQNHCALWLDEVRSSFLLFAHYILLFAQLNIIICSSSFAE
jgi:glyoxylase-like metal-dependent hydrolase (beta-lactamase superfamily II)